MSDALELVKSLIAANQFDRWREALYAHMVMKNALMEFGAGSNTQAQRDAIVKKYEPPEDRA